MFTSTRLTQLLLSLLTLMPISTSQKYTVYPTAKTWTESKASCEADGRQLVVIQSLAEIAEFQDFLKLQISSRMWIGLRVPPTSKSELDFHWVDGTAMKVSDWDGDEPNNLDRMKCVLIQAEDDDKWNTRPCSEMYPFVCELVNRVIPVHSIHDAEQVSSIGPFGFFVLKPWTGNCDSQSSIIPGQSAFLLYCCASCLAHDRCHMITWNQSTCGIVFDSDALPCYCQNNCVAYRRMRHA